MSQSNASPENLVLACTPEKTEDRIVLAYEITNRGAETWFIMDAMVGVDPATDSSAATLGTFLKADLAKWGPIVQAAGVQLD